MPSTRLIISYILDWLVIIALFAAGGGINFLTPYKRPFSLVDLTISYPFAAESISTVTLVLVSLIAPGVIIVLVALLLIPSRPYSKSLDRSQTIRLKLWELEKGLAGLGLSTGLAFFVGQGLKQLVGKPRPDLLARCMPDLTNIAAHVVGGYAQTIDVRWALVSATICTNPDTAIIDEGFRSWPSGHSTFSWAGLLYLTLWLCAKFGVWWPHLPTARAASPQSKDGAVPALPSSPTTGGDVELLPLHSSSATMNTQTSRPESKQGIPLPTRNAGATPPNYLLILAWTPLAVAMFICTTRYAQFWHHGIDVIAGSVIGILAAIWSYRWYHLPMSRGEGWAWGARHPDKAFGIGVGTGGYVE